MSDATRAQTGRREPARTASVLRRLAGFAADQGIPTGRAYLLDRDVIEAFCVQGLTDRASSTRGTYRSVLYQQAGPARGRPQPRPTPFPAATAPPPYCDQARAELTALARAQRDPLTRASALAMVIFGIGAGLRPGELAALRGSEVTRRGTGVIVRVSGGPAPRTVPVAPRYADRALRLAGHSGDGYIFRPGPAQRGYKNFVNGFARRLAGDPAAPRPSMSRARSSFICDHLAAGTPIPVLLHIAGITEAESLARYARHVSGIRASKAALRSRWRAQSR